MMFERTPLVWFITPPTRAKRAGTAVAARLAAGGRAVVSSPLRALTTQCTRTCRVLKRLLVRIPPWFHGLGDIHLHSEVWILPACHKKVCGLPLSPPSSLKTFGDVWMNRRKLPLEALHHKTMKSEYPGYEPGVIHLFHEMTGVTAIVQNRVAKK